MYTWKNRFFKATFYPLVFKLVYLSGHFIVLQNLLSVDSYLFYL